MNKPKSVSDFFKKEIMETRKNVKKAFNESKGYSKPMQPKEEWVIDFQNKFSTIRILEAGKDKLGNWDVVRSGNEEIIKFISTLLQEQHRKTIEECEKDKERFIEHYQGKIAEMRHYEEKLENKIKTLHEKYLTRLNKLK